MRQPRQVRRGILMLADLLMLSIILALLTRVRMVAAPAFETPDELSLLALALLPPISMAALYLTGFYRLVTRHIGRKGVWHAGGALLAAIMAWALLIFLAEWRTHLITLPRTVIIAYFFSGWMGILLLREFARWWLQDLPLQAVGDRNERKRVLIYGAGDAGVALLKLLRETGTHEVRGFLDRDRSLHGMKMLGLFPVYGLHELGSLLEREEIDEIIISRPRLSHATRRRVARELSRFPIRLRVVAEPVDLLAAGTTSPELREMDIHDLLGREPAQPIPELMRANITGKSVMVTGAGGSIGSEIVRKVLSQQPKKVILFDLSEYALYRIEQELLDISCEGEETPRIVPVLGSVGDEALVRRVIREHGVQTIYHAAAYKHIPLLEKNIRAAVENNVLATATLAFIAGECGVERLVHISSDKAVRPANVKGATNRLQELVVQASAKKWPRTIFTAVRFGNVLGSSGSVVPRFREQIAKGGPLTITHPEATRYFMSIAEAAELVIQAGALAKGADIYALDMGDPIRIVDLARMMVHLSGLRVADANNPNGDIELKITGPRPGDKLHEELLINGHAVPTRHPSIMLLDEAISLTITQVEAMLRDLRAAISADDVEAMRCILGKYVEGFGAPPSRLDERHGQGIRKNGPLPSCLKGGNPLEHEISARPFEH